MIPYGRQSISDEDIASVVSVLKSDFLTQGNAVPAFEQALAQYTGAKHTVAVNSGTSALHLACRALGLTTGDVAWTSPISFVASANCALYCGADVDFIDVANDCPLMDVNALEHKLAKAEKSGTLPKVLIPVHFAGLSCDMEAIRSLADKYHFSIIEDACHALGGSFQRQRIGSCRYSDIAVFSFHPVKSITTGEGGVALTENAELADAMRLLRTHGIAKAQEEMIQKNQGGWYYEQIALGYNYRMTDLQAALGISQLKRLDEFIRARCRLAMRYDRGLASLPFATLPHPSSNCESAHHLYPVCLTSDTPKSRLETFQHLRNNGIGAQVHYIPIYAHPYYKERFSEEQYPNAQTYYEKVISLPLYPDMTDAQQDTVVEALAKI